MPTNLPYGYAPDDPPREPPDDPLREPPAPPKPTFEQRLKRGLGPLGVLLFAGLMWAAKLKILLLALTKIKYFGTAASSLVSIGAYALLWGWRSRWWWSRSCSCTSSATWWRCGARASRPARRCSSPSWARWSPQVDAARRRTEAKVGLAGRCSASPRSVVVLAAAISLDSDLLRGAAYFGFFINLFNLIP